MQLVSASRVSFLTENELAFVTALADQATLAVMHARLAAQASEAAALSERSRLARELHDSVSQALFSMKMHARAAQLATTKTGVHETGPLALSLNELSKLSSGALAEMRALIFQLRPDALADEGLLAALQKQAAALAAQEPPTVTIHGPKHRVQLDLQVEEQLYRITVEALHNVVQHAQARHAAVRIETVDDSVHVTITDDGKGFNPQAPRPGHFGLSTMAERAQTVGALLTIASSADHGTTVTVTAPCYAGGASLRG